MIQASDGRDVHITHPNPPSNPNTTCKPQILHTHIAHMHILSKDLPERFIKPPWSIHTVSRLRQPLTSPTATDDDRVFRLSAVRRPSSDPSVEHSCGRRLLVGVRFGYAGCDGDYCTDLRRAHLRVVGIVAQSRDASSLSRRCEARQKQRQSREDAKRLARPAIPSAASGKSGARAR
jgi:hypothetical protein